MFAFLKLFPKQSHLDVLFLGGDDALPHEEAVVLKELVVLLRLLLALVQQEADHPLLQNVTKLPEDRGDGVKTGSIFEYKYRTEKCIVHL